MGALSGIDVGILAGGLGTRLRSVIGTQPKILAPVADDGTPFLSRLLDVLESHGAKRLVFLLGFGADAVRVWLENNRMRERFQIVFSEEKEPLGTAGALRLARPLFFSDPAVVLNGDCWTDANIENFLEFHRKRKAGLSLLCVQVPDKSRFGTVDCAADGSAVRFNEKDPEQTGPGWISAGFYLWSQTALDQLMTIHGPSLEFDVYKPGRIAAMHAHQDSVAEFIDIGTPESLSAAKRIIPGR